MNNMIEKRRCVTNQTTETVGPGDENYVRGTRYSGSRITNDKCMLRNDFSLQVNIYIYVQYRYIGVCACVRLCI